MFSQAASRRRGHRRRRQTGNSTADARIKNKETWDKPLPVPDLSNFVVDGTPTFFINSQRHDGDFELETLLQGIKKMIHSYKGTRWKTCCRTRNGMSPILN